MAVRIRVTSFTTHEHTGSRVRSHAKTPAIRRGAGTRRSAGYNDRLNSPHARTTMTLSLTRRQALQLGAAAPLGYLFTGPASSVVKADGANGRLRVAGIGVGGKGSSDIEQAGALMDVVALCDIDEQRLGQRATTWPKARRFSDYRKLFDEIGKEIDAVTVSTPDHHHALPSL